MYRVQLNEEQREELARRAREKGLAPRTRDRLEMVRLSDAGWSVPRIAAHLKISQSRTRHWVKAFLHGGFEALPDQPHPGQKSKLTPSLLQELHEKIAVGERTWSAAQLAETLMAQHGISVTPGHLRRMLHRVNLTYKRTGRSVRHKQKEEDVREKRSDLETLKRGHRQV